MKKQIIKGWKKFNTSANAAVTSPRQEKVDESKANTVVEDLSAITSRLAETLFTVIL